MLWPIFSRMIDFMVRVRSLRRLEAIIHDRVVAVETSRNSSEATIKLYELLEMLNDYLERPGISRHKKHEMTRAYASALNAVEVLSNRIPQA
jgi:hypothetical protein